MSSSASKNSTGPDGTLGRITVPLGTLPSRIALAAVAAAILALIWFGVRWQLGNMLGELTLPAQPGAGEVAQLAMSLAPADPLPKWLAAASSRQKGDTASYENSVLLMEDVVRSSPYDYRWWIELGRAYEQAGDAAKAEAAIQQAVALAPTYTFAHWQLGNFYLRNGRPEEAFAQLRRTTEQSMTYREQVFQLAWEYFEKDPAMVERYAAEGPDVRASLALFYARAGSPENAVRIWNTLEPEARDAHRGIAKLITQHLYTKRFYRATLEFARQTGIDREAASGVISNGGFESFIGESKDTLFGWRVNRSDGKLDVAAESAVKAEGARSLRLRFRGYAKPEIYNVVQLVAVEPGTYELTFSIRTEDLRTGGEPLVEVVNANTDEILAASPRFPLGTNDWQRLSVQFVVPEGCEGIVVRTNRVSCGETCPITGTVWYDDFRLQRRTQGGVR
jgi:tetratricopeptide (TPR) repeat protein